MLFSIYTLPIGRIIDSFGVQHHHYADDTTLYMRIRKGDSLPPTVLNDCFSALTLWFLYNDMQLNPSKTEAMAIGTLPQLRKIDTAKPIDISGVSVQLAEEVKIVGVTIDSRLSFDNHITNICSSANHHIRALRHIRSSLTHDMACTLACSIVSSRLDYCNSVLNGVSPSQIDRLQRVQNNLARTVCCSPRHSNASELLQRLHWLPVKHRISYKTSILTYTALNLGTPSYLSELLQKPALACTLRSSADTLRLVVPVTKTAMAARSFSVTAPTIWNNLSILTRSADSITRFKSLLKTELFLSAFIS